MSEKTTSLDFKIIIYMEKIDSMCYKLLTVLLSGDYCGLIFFVLFSIFLIFYNQYNLL